jgi:hypothetical protein
MLRLAVPRLSTPLDSRMRRISCKTGFSVLARATPGPGEVTESPTSQASYFLPAGYRISVVPPVLNVDRNSGENLG